MHAKAWFGVVLIAAAGLAVTVLVSSNGERSPLPGSSPRSEPRPPAAQPPEPITAGVEEPAVADSSAAPAAREPLAVIDEASGQRIPIGDEERVRRRAAALAEKLGLSEADRESLLEVLLEEQTRRAAALRDLRTASDQAAARARVRAELDDILAWKTEELQTRFGAELAAAMMRR